MSKHFFVSRKGLSALLQMREALQNELYKATKQMGESVKRDNDLRENPEYMQLQTKISYELPSKISDIGRIIGGHILIEETDAIKNNIYDEVVPGCQVEVEDENGHQRVFSIMGYNESNPSKGVISYLTPIAQSLLHKVIGEEVELIFNGKHISYEITAIRRSPQLS